VIPGLNRTKWFVKVSEEILVNATSQKMFPAYQKPPQIRQTVFFTEELSVKQEMLLVNKAFLNHAPEELVVDVWKLELNVRFLNLILLTVNGIRLQNPVNRQT
jgi:hypothetical protein